MSYDLDPRGVYACDVEAGRLAVERSGVDPRGVFLAMEDTDNLWLSPEDTRKVRDQLTEILGDQETAAPDVIHGAKERSSDRSYIIPDAEPTLSPVATARLEVVRQLVELGVEAGDVPAILDAIAGELPGGVAVRRLGSREPDYWIAPERGCSVDFNL